MVVAHIRLHVFAWGLCNVIQGMDLVYSQTKSGISAYFCGLLQATVFTYTLWKPL